MKARNNSVSGLDFQKEYLSVAQYSPEENAVALIAIQPVTDENHGDLLDRAACELKELKGKFKFATPDVVCSLPSEYAIIKRVQIDNDEQDAQDAIEWELGQQIIGSLDDYSFDFHESGLPVQEQLREYLVVAYRNEIVQRMASIVRSLKLNPLVIDLDAVALINVFEANYRDRISAPALLVHGESEVTKLILTQNGNLLDYGTFEYDFASLDTRNYPEMLQHHAGCLLSTATTGGESTVGTFLSGSLFAQPQFSDGVIQGLPGSEILYPFRKITCHVGVDEEQLKNYAAQLAVAVGLALRGGSE
jgi:Tfp pilus assembly PilM family ATPase